MRSSKKQQQQQQHQMEASKMKIQSKLIAKLHWAANEGQVELVRLLLRCGADVNAAQDEDCSANTALHLAAWKGFSETVHVLCKYRAQTSQKNNVSLLLFLKQQQPTQCVCAINYYTKALVAPPSRSSHFRRAPPCRRRRRR